MATDSYGSERSGSPGSNGENGERGSRQMITLRFIANDREAGSIIGKRGDNIKKVRDESGSRINISDSSSPERIVTVTGGRTEIVKAFSMMCTKFEEDGQYFENALTQIVFRFIILNSNCGSLIGKSGSNIKELRESTGATIQVGNDMLPNSNERAVTVSGCTESVMQCIQRLCTIATETKTRIPVMPYLPMRRRANAESVMFNDGRMGFHPGLGARNFIHHQQQMNKRQMMMGGDVTSIYSNLDNLYSNDYSGLINSYPTQDQRQTQTQEIIIPNQSIGCIIGKQGTRINRIRQSSNAIIRIADLEEGSSDRKVTIMGSPNSVSCALYLINSIQTRYAPSAKTE